MLLLLKKRMNVFFQFRREMIESRIVERSIQFFSQNNASFMFSQYQSYMFLKHTTYLRGNGLVPIDAACWMSWGEGRLLLMTSFHCLLSFIFVTFSIHWPLSRAASIVSRCCSCFVCSGLTYEIYIVCYHVIAAPYVKNIIMSLPSYTLYDDTGHPMHYDISLFHNVFLKFKICSK